MSLSSLDPGLYRGKPTVPLNFWLEAHFPFYHDFLTFRVHFTTQPYPTTGTKIPLKAKVDRFRHYTLGSRRGGYGLTWSYRSQPQTSERSSDSKQKLSDAEDPTTEESPVPAIHSDRKPCKQRSPQKTENESYLTLRIRPLMKAKDPPPPRAATIPQVGTIPGVLPDVPASARFDTFWTKQRFGELPRGADPEFKRLAAAWFHLIEEACADEYKHFLASAIQCQWLVDDGKRNQTFGAALRARDLHSHLVNHLHLHISKTKRKGRENSAGRDDNAFR
ncbi:hypothetical protein FA15DRAFT_656416 [Coprinopsis marcescibilis]|uniref:Uncharacterized protein n=1 Tax=Coprinopsis marcescibilis TaxID=230819 RepID=A0A5C3KTJ4_COPMA|nr:hypothetical protein FA15DRAFT_656416 [Coprinopsis marcescibilis]